MSSRYEPVEFRQRPVVSPNLRRAVAWACVIEAVAGGIGLALFFFGLPWLVAIAALVLE